jgi:hypothetical protein
MIIFIEELLGIAPHERGNNFQRFGGTSCPLKD